MSNSKAFGSLALIASGIIGGIAPIVSKFALLELPPITVLFIRIFIMLLVLFPFVLLNPIKFKANFKKLTLLGILWFINVILFILAIKNTSAFTSQILYAMVPIFILLENQFISKTKLPKAQIMGIFLGFLGVLLIIWQSFSNQSSYDTPLGSILIFIASIAWSLYLLLSQRLRIHISPEGLTFISALVALILTLPLMLTVEPNGLQNIFNLSLQSYISLLILGLLVGVVMVFLINFGIRYGSALIASSNVYIATLVSAYLGFLFFKEGLTFLVILGGIFIILSIFFTAIYPLLKRRLLT